MRYNYETVFTLLRVDRQKTCGAKYVCPGPQRVSKQIKFEIKPLVRFKLTGTIAKGFSQSDIYFHLPDSMIFSVSKEFTVENFEKKMLNLP